MDKFIKKWMKAWLYDPRTDEYENAITGERISAKETKKS